MELMRRSGWADERRRLALDEAALRASFKKRWNDVTGMKGPALALTLDEERALLGFLLRHPPRPPGGVSAPSRARAHEDQVRLKKVEELGAVDPAYPVDLARGVVLYRLRRYPLAVQAFARHLAAHPDGPHALRAQNYLRAAIGRANDEL